jgi:heme oxygenase (biliverdin-IX-beta and delta-forming)
VLVDGDPISKLRPKNARHELQSATQDVHERLHRHPGLSHLAAGTVDRDEYRCLLARSFGFYAVVEPMLGLAGRLTECLVQDLTELGVDAAAIDALPLCDRPRIGCDPAAMIGARYVLLGASLGGKVMARAIASRNDGRAALPVRFLTGMGENDWKVFAAELEDNLPNAASRTAAAIAARATFAAYEEWMTWYE